MTVFTIKAFTHLKRIQTPFLCGSLRRLVYAGDHACGERGSCLAEDEPPHRLALGVQLHAHRPFKLDQWSSWFLAYLARPKFESSPCAGCSGMQSRLRALSAASLPERIRLIHSIDESALEPLVREVETVQNKREQKPSSGAEEKTTLEIDLWHRYM